MLHSRITADGTLQLTNGRSLRMTRFSQHDIYAEVVEGVPCALVNRRTIDTQRQNAARTDGHAPLLIEPTPTLLPNPRGDTGDFEPARIPPIVCHAHFRSTPTPRARASDDVSELTVIWFQEHYGLPSEPTILRALQTMDWDRLARDQGFF